MKQCDNHTCLQVLPLEAFNQDVTAEDGFQHWCRRCLNAYNRVSNPFFERVYEAAGGFKAYKAMDKKARKAHREDVRARRV